MVVLKRGCWWWWRGGFWWFRVFSRLYIVALVGGSVDCRWYRGGLWWWQTCGVKGVMCGADLCGLIPTTARVATTISSTINPPWTNSWIVCCRKDRGSCGCSCRWLCSFRFCLIWWQTPYGINVCPLSVMWWRCSDALWWRCFSWGGGGVLDGWSCFFLTQFWCWNGLRTRAIWGGFLLEVASVTRVLVRRH